jgi:hypothetical protein
MHEDLLDEEAEAAEEPARTGVRWDSPRLSEQSDRVVNPIGWE